MEYERCKVILFKICWLARHKYCGFFIFWIVNCAWWMTWTENATCFEELNLFRVAWIWVHESCCNTAIIDWLQFKIDFCMRIPNAEHWISSALNDFLRLCNTKELKFQSNLTYSYEHSNGNRQLYYLYSVQIGVVPNETFSFFIFLLFNQSTFW